MQPLHDFAASLTRRHFFGKSAAAIGTAALASLLNPALGDEAKKDAIRVAPGLRVGGLENIPHFAPKAKRVIYLFQSGAPSQMDLFDYKPRMGAMFDKDLPESVRMGQRLTTMTSGQARFPIAPSKYRFEQHGNCGMWVSELFPALAERVDEPRS
jgi:hypothetical protein